MNVIFREETEQIIATGKLSDDKLKLFIDVARVQGKALPSKNDLIALLSRHINRKYIEPGVLDDILRQLHLGQSAISQRRIAHGEAPLDGIDGRFEILAKPYMGIPDIRLDSPGKIVFSDLHLFDNIEQGDVVARVYAPIPGTDGIDALGNPIPFLPGAPVIPQYDSTVALRPLEDENAGYSELVAREEGLLLIDGSRFRISSVFKIAGDLDFRYGNVDFIGSLRIAGDVMQGFHIRGRKEIEIGGNVHGGNRLWSHGPISIGGHVHGGPGSSIVCGGELRAASAQEINTEVIGDIIIDNEVLNSTLRTSGQLRIPYGAIVGGTIYAVKGVEAHQIGNEAGARTSIVLSSDIEASMAYSRILVNIENHSKAIDMLSMRLGPLAERPLEIELLKEPARSKLLALAEKLRKLREARSFLYHQKYEMMHHARRLNNLLIRFRGTLHEGVVIRCGSDRFEPPETLQGPAMVEFRLKDRSFHIVPLSL